MQRSRGWACKVRAWEARYRRVASWDTTHPSGIAAQKREEQREPADHSATLACQRDITARQFDDHTATPSTEDSLRTFLELLAQTNLRTDEQSLANLISTDRATDHRRTT